MKFVLALLVHVALGGAIAVGILIAVYGSPWLLIGSVLVYLGLLVRIGCLGR